jgi:hypothetical protein
MAPERGPSTALMRRVFWAAALFNAGGALLFAFPASPPGALAGLPAAAPPVYRALVALFVLLFAGMYAALARQAAFDRALVWLGALGKAGAFLCVLALWLGAAAPGRSVAVIGGDLAFALVFGWWLATSRAEPVARR